MVHVAACVHERLFTYRLTEDAGLQEEYVRRNCTRVEIDEILAKSELVHAARKRMEQVFESGELDPHLSP